MTPALTRQTVTTATRTTLVLYPSLMLCQGLSYVLGDSSRTQTPSFHFAALVMPIRAWGWLFLALGCFIVAGYRMKSRDVTVFVLFAAAGAYLIWAFTFAITLFTTPDSSLMGPVWPLFAAVAIIVTARSVASQEVSVRSTQG